MTKDIAKFLRTRTRLERGGVKNPTARDIAAKCDLSFARVKELMNRFRNHGKPWSSEDVEMLMENKDTKSIEELADDLGRTEESIRSKIRAIAREGRTHLSTEDSESEYVPSDDEENEDRLEEERDKRLLLERQVANLEESIATLDDSYHNVLSERRRLADEISRLKDSIRSSKLEWERTKESYERRIDDCKATIDLLDQAIAEKNQVIASLGDASPLRSESFSEERDTSEYTSILLVSVASLCGLAYTLTYCVWV